MWKYRVRASFFSLMVGLALFFGSLDRAEASSGGNIVVLLTEIADAGVVSEGQEVSFWWSGGQRAQWTGTDEAVFSGLRRAGVEPLKPSEINISRIYRRPDLAATNAAQLGGLLGGQQVLVGRVEYGVIPGIAPLNFDGIEARAEVELIAAGSSDGISLQRFTVERHFFGERGDGRLFEEAQAELGEALGELMGYSLSRIGGTVGVESEKPLLGLRNLERAENLEILRRRLLEIEEVHSVVERWASEGIIALEINPGVDDGEVSSYAIRVLENHHFDEFRLEREPSQVGDGLVQFWVEPVERRY